MLRPLAALAAVIVASGGLGVHAQTRWLAPRNFNSVAVEVMKPFFDSDDVTFVSSAAVVTGQVAFGREQRTFLTVDLPIAHFGVDGGDSETAIGNPYVGATSFARDSPVVYELGVRIPIASDNAAAIAGQFVDVDRFEAYAVDRFSATGSLIYFPSRSGDWVMQTRLGPTLLINTADPGEFEARGDLYANYSVQTWYFSGRFQGALGFSGRFLITDNGSIGERTVHQAGVMAGVDLVHAIPGLQLRLPLDDDLTDIVDFIVVLSVVVPL